MQSVQHITGALAQDKADVAALDTRLKHTPVIVHFKGKDYPRFIPDSETGFTRNDGREVSGQYAEVRHLR